MRLRRVAVVSGTDLSRRRFASNDGLRTCKKRVERDERAEADWKSTSRLERGRKCGKQWAATLRFFASIDNPNARRRPIGGSPHSRAAEHARPDAATARRFNRCYLSAGAQVRARDQSGVGRASI